MNSVQVLVATRLKELGPEVESRVVEVLVERELKRRADAITLVIDQLEQLEKDFHRLKPDASTYSEDGTLLTAAFTKGALENRKKASEKIEKYRKALAKALEKDDMADVYNLMSAATSGSGGGGGKGQTGGGASQSGG